MKPSTCIIMSDSRKPSADDSMINLTSYANFKYAKHNGYDFILYRPYINNIDIYDTLCCVNPNYGTKRHGSWAKLLAFHHTLKSYDRVVYLDSDAIFNNLNSVEYFLSQHITNNKKVFFLTDHPFNEKTPCAGFFIADHSAEAFCFLREWFCGIHNEPHFDYAGTLEQASLAYNKLVNVELQKYYTLLPVNQFKYTNLNAGPLYRHLPNDLPVHDLTGNRTIINHYRKKIYEEIKADVERVYGTVDYNEIINNIIQNVVHFKTIDYKF